MSGRGKENVYHATTRETGSIASVTVCTNAASQVVPPFIIMKRGQEEGMPTLKEYLIGDSCTCPNLVYDVRRNGEMVGSSCSIIVNSDENYCGV
jgi:hypothetical protein